MRFERVQVHDVYSEGEEVVVMTGEGHVVALSPIAAHVWHLLEGGAVEEKEIVRSITAKFGEPGPDLGVDAATELMATLSDTGLIQDPRETSWASTQLPEV